MAYPGYDLTGKTALVSGGTSGLGRAIAMGLARSAARVVVASRDEAKVADTARELAQHGPGHGGLLLDVSDGASVDRVVGQTVEQYGGLDILVNAAGTTMKKPSMELTREDW